MKKKNTKSEKSRLLILEALVSNGLATPSLKKKFKSLDRKEAKKLLGRKLIEDEIA